MTAVQVKNSQIFSNAELLQITKLSFQYSLSETIETVLVFFLILSVQVRSVLVGRYLHPHKNFKNTD